MPDLSSDTTSCHLPRFLFFSNYSLVVETILEMYILTLLNVQLLQAYISHAVIGECCISHYKQ